MSIVHVAGRIMLLRRQGKLAFATMRDSTRRDPALRAGRRGRRTSTSSPSCTWGTGSASAVRSCAPSAASCRSRWRRGSAWPRPSTTSATSGPASPTSTCAIATARPTCGPTRRRARSLQRRSDMIRAVRERCWAAGFMEVETPILNAIPSGATRRPFVTHHNALDSDFFLRVAPELWLKRLVVGGFERVFELGRVFRNEGVSPRHNPEFTMLELYAAYWDYEDMMSFTEELVAGVALDVLGTTEIEYQGRQLSFATPWPRRTDGRARERGDRRGGLGAHAARRSWRAICASAASRCTPSWGAGRCLAELFEATAEEATVGRDLRHGVSPSRSHRSRVATGATLTSPSASSPTPPGANSPTASAN